MVNIYKGVSHRVLLNVITIEAIYKREHGEITSAQSKTREQSDATETPLPHGHVICIREERVAQPVYLMTFLS